MTKSLTEEINGNYVAAVQFYEAEIANQEASSDTFINLAFLYWSFAFELFEFVIPNNIPDSWSEMGANRYGKILDLGAQKFPENMEIIFWKRYFSHIIFGEAFTPEECLDLIEKGNGQNCNVLYFFLYLFNKEIYQQQRDDLLKEIRCLKTAKNTYIESIITGNCVS